MDIIKECLQKNDAILLGAFEVFIANPNEEEKQELADTIEKIILFSKNNK